MIVRGRLSSCGPEGESRGNFIFWDARRVIRLRLEVY